MCTDYDLLIIGGGINGCGIARDAAGRGWRVGLCEQDDLASATSSASTKLIHGGLRYLETYEFRLVREALTEREVIWAIAPHLVSPLRFILPHHPQMRPRWLLRLGLFLYDHLGGRRLLPPTKTLDLSSHAAGLPLSAFLRGVGFEYSDCWVDDARLVVMNALSAAQHAAVIMPRTRVVAAVREGAHWRVDVQDMRTQRTWQVRARALVNAAGAWAAQVAQMCAPPPSPQTRLRFVRGAHVIVPRLFEHSAGYIFQNPDGRIVFALPYEGNFTLIGTTDRDLDGSPRVIDADEEEILYLINAVSPYFEKQIQRHEVVASYAGVRALYEDGAKDAAKTTRDYVLELSAKEGEAPLLSVFGGKITTYRRLAEAALAQLTPFLPEAAGRGAGWTAHVPLPGGDFPAGGVDLIIAGVQAAYPFLVPAVTARLVRSYGTKVFDVLGNAQNLADLGQDFGAGLSARELAYLHQTEWAQTAQDVLERRSKLYLHLSSEQQEQVAQWFDTTAAGRCP